MFHSKNNDNLSEITKFNDEKTGKCRDAACRVSTVLITPSPTPSEREGFPSYCLNHDFHKIFRINKIIKGNLANLINLMEIVVQDKIYRIRLIVMLGFLTGVIFMIIGAETAGFGLAQTSLEIILKVITSPFAGA